MDLATFTEKVYQVLIRNFPDRQFDPPIVPGKITTTGLQLGLTNLLAEYLAAPPNDEEWERLMVLNFTRAFAMVKNSTNVLPETWEDAKDRIRVQLANSRIREMELSLAFPFAEDVWSAVVVDADSGYAYVRADDAKRWGQSAVDLQEIGRANLLKASENVQMLQVPGKDGMILLQTNDGYDAARVLLPEFRERLIEALNPTSDAAWVGVPNRDFLIAWPIYASPEFSARIREQIALDAESQHHPLSKVPFRITRDTIEPAP